MAGNVPQAALGAAARAGGRLLGLKLGAIAGAAVLLSSLIVGPIIAIGGIPHTNQGAGVDPACGEGSADVLSASTHEPVAGFSDDELKNAAAIINAGDALGVPAYGINIGVMTAIGESGLRVLDYGDAAGPDSRGLFQQRESWGPLSVRMDPTGSATLFFQRLLKVPGWQGMTPTEAGHAVQINADPNYYARYWAVAQSVVTALTNGTGGGCEAIATGDPTQLARQIMSLTKDNKIRWLTPAYEKQVEAYANSGGTPPSCYLDPRLLQVIAAVATKFEPIGISDLNRQCTGDTPGAGTASYHWKGKAVDFYMLGGVSTTGRDANADAAIQLLDQLTNTRGAVGQEFCGSLGGYALQNLYTFDDTCNHLHYQLGPGTDPLRLSSSSSAAGLATREGINQ